ncbi:hypothetical protein [Chryseobacterium rhizosphaerae]|uniref:hypothetical protein n=1 Tax=Chryseobacterium rhizosphaerae TaxID=395937 RepID=UPI003D13AF55
MNDFIEVNEIEIAKISGVGLTENYPESGVYKVKSETTFDLVFVDKTLPNVYFICPMDVVERLGLFASKQREATNMSTFINTPYGYVSEDFVLGFAKLLLRKNNIK